MHPQPSFHVVVERFTICQEIEGAWKAANFRSMLEAMEYGDTGSMTDAELREMCLLSLQELPPETAAEVVLRQRFGARLTDGRIRNLANELQEEKLWEEYADMAFHEQMFHVGSLLYMASPETFPDPDAVKVQLQVVASNGAAKDILNHPLPEAFLVRLLADGMDDRSTLHRLFEDQLKGRHFPEAENIVWIVNTQATDAKTVTVEIISSGYWLDALRGMKSYDSAAYPDAAGASTSRHE